MRKLCLLVAAACVLAVASPARAQSSSDFTAYLALIFTPPAALPPVVTSTMLGRSASGTQFALRYGHLSEEGTGVNTFAGTLEVPAGTKASFGLTAGYLTFSGCDGCDGHFLAGVSGQGTLASSRLGAEGGGDAALLTIGLRGEVGFAKPTDATILTLTAGLPVALAAGGPTLKVAPFLTPAIGFGRVSNGLSESGNRFLLGGGVGIVSTTNGLGATVGFQKAFIEGGSTTVGVNVMLGMK
jgi:hypothetical protein